MATRRVEIPEVQFALLVPDGPWLSLVEWRKHGTSPREFMLWLPELFEAEGIDPERGKIRQRQRKVILEGPPLTEPPEPVDSAIGGPSSTLGGGQTTTCQPQSKSQSYADGEAGMAHPTRSAHPTA